MEKAHTSCTYSMAKGDSRLQDLMLCTESFAILMDEMKSS